MPAAQRGPQRPPPRAAPAARACPVVGPSHPRVSGRSSASPPLAQAFAPTLRQELCQGSPQQGPLRLSAAQARFPWKSWWWPCKPHPQSSQGHLLLTPALYKHDLAESSPSHAQAGPPGSKNLLSPLPALLISKHRNQAMSSVLQLLLNPPQPLHQQRWFRKSSLISTGPNPSLVKRPRPCASAAAPAGTANPAGPDWDQSRSTGTREGQTVTPAPW